MAGKDDFGGPPSSHWISEGVEVLFEEIARSPDQQRPRFDVLVVGSGYGGSIAAAEFSAATVGGRKASVCVLERGLEYLPGMFPSRMAELPGHVRFSTPGDPRPRGNREGLFDLRLGKDLHAVVANGLGGGSLINAGVLMPPHRSVLAEAAWPEAVRHDLGAADSGAPWSEVRELLGARTAAGNPCPDTILGWRDRDGSARPAPPKFEAMRRLADEAGAVPIQVAMANGLSAGGQVALSACIGCGDCATGCNHGAKISHDLNLLVRAFRQGARIYTGATVLRIKPLAPEGWSVDIQYTDEQLRRRQGPPVAVTARRVVLAAGTFGSTEILLRSRSDQFRLSDQLGRRFSGNGDIFAAIWKANDPIQSVADETTDPAGRGIGPTITAVIDRRTGNPETDHVIQELSVPGPLREVFAEGFTTTQVVHDLAHCDRTVHGGEAVDPLAVDPGVIARSTAIAVIGRDQADGRMALTDGEDPDAGDGAVRVVWPQARYDARQAGLLRRVQEERGWRGFGARLLANPMWQLLPQELERQFGGECGPLITVHPLGGCAMGEDVAAGVVDHLGRVFRAGDPPGGGPFHDGLVVLDGAIVPTSLGINPSLTIATLALRAARELKRGWFDTEVPAPGALAALVRPSYASPKAPGPRVETQVEFVERLSGTLELDLDGAGRRELAVEITLRSRPVELVPWLRDMNRAQEVDEGSSRLRIFPLECWRRRDEMCDAQALVIASLSGTLQVLQREPSRAWQRIRCATWPWIANRGLRDAIQRPRQTPRHALRIFLAVASRAGERRSFTYRLRVGAIDQRQPAGQGALRLRAGDEIVGCKRLTYSRRAGAWLRGLTYARPFNPWWQLVTMQVLRFPCWQEPWLGPGGELKLDLPYLARIGVPMVRIVAQQNQAEALADLAKLAGYFARLLLNIHALTFRQPDQVQPRNIDRLPGTVAGLPQPTITWLDLPPPREGLQVRLRLTRYPAPRRAGRPVLLIHGYSASGTTFAHPSVRPGLAKHLHDLGGDVWIVDLRTSAGLPTAGMAWAFEDAAYADIPLAVDHILLQTGAEQLDIVAHCMGSAMTWMALLGPGPQAPARDWYRHEREALPMRIRRLVASQVGPVNIFSPDNTLRAYVMRYVKLLAPLKDYQFRVEGKPPLADQLMDRLLASLPYPEAEFDRENPFPWFWKRTPWAGARHRIDALYARAFELGTVDDAMLAAIDDFFGPLNVDTVSQVIHFATYRVLTDRHGANQFVSRDRIRDRVRFPVLSIHGVDNGLVDSESQGLREAVLKGAHPDIDLRCWTVPGAGHQDCLIGSSRHEVFAKIAEFLK